jgi:VanZ family protein
MVGTARRRHLRHLITNWLPIALWAALIFYFSTDQFSSSHTSELLEPLLTWLFPGISADRIASIHFALRKLGHLSEYMIFGVLLLRALPQERGRRFKGRHAACTVAFVFIYAVSDELHQGFVASRTASFGDVLIDLFGGICGTFWMLLHRKGNRET